jgi:hypothetical protein
MSTIANSARSFTLLIWLILPCAALATDAPKSIITRKFELSSSLGIDCKDLEYILDEARPLIESANGGSAPPRAVIAEATLEAPTTSYTASDWSNLCASRDSPMVALSFQLRYSNPYAPIAHLIIDFDDYRRRIEVDGSDSAQVNALAILLERRFEEHTVSYSGTSFRIGSIVIWMLLTAMTMAIALWRIIPNTVLTVDFDKRTFEKSTDRPEPKPALLIGIIISPIVIMMLLMVFCPWNEWFPGTAIYKESGGFLHRHADGLGLFYFVVPLVVSAIPLVGPWLASSVTRYTHQRRPR